MRRDRKRAWAVTALCLGGLAACGGQVGVEGCGFLVHVDCPAWWSGGSSPVSASLSPLQQTVQVGGTATFKVTAAGVVDPVYEWRRSSDGGRTFVPIPGADSATYALAGVQLPDDGVLFIVDLYKDGVRVAETTSVALAVSSMPAVVFEDSEFAAADWTADATPVPLPAGAGQTSEQATSGGNPGAFRRMTYALPSGPSFMRVFNTALAAVYDPATQGPLYLIDVAEACSVAAPSPSIAYVDSNLMVEQAGRRYAAKGSTRCGPVGWASVRRSALRIEDLVLVDGPACTVGESCPDFSAAGAPLRFGYFRDAAVAYGNPAGSIVHGIDNWKVTLWRR